MTKNRRKNYRLNSLNLLNIGVYENGSLIKQGIGRTLNVSESGILFESYFPIKPESEVQLSIGLEEDLVEIKGKVIHTMQDSARKYKIGIKFNKIKKLDFDVLKVYIADFTALMNREGI